MRLKPGELVIVRGSFQVTRHASEEVSWTSRPSVCLVMALSYRMREADDRVDDVYLVLASHDMRLYEVADTGLLTFDQYRDASRLFPVAHPLAQE